MPPRPTANGGPPAPPVVDAPVRSDESWLLRLAQSASFGVLVGERDGSISYVNTAFERLIGYSLAEIQDAGLSWVELTPPEYRPRDAEAVSELLTTGAARPYEKAFLARNGRRVPVLVGAAVIDTAPDGRRTVAAFITDLTEVKEGAVERERLIRAQEEARGAAELAGERSAQLLRITAALSRALSPERVAEIVIDAGGQALGAFGGVVSVLDSSQEALTILAAHGYTAISMEQWARIPLTVPVPLSDAVRRGEPIFIHSLKHMADCYPTLARSSNYLRTRSSVALPLTLDTQVLGALGFSFEREGPLADEERTFLMTLAGLCAQALERTRLSVAEREALAAADEALALLDTIIDSAPIGLAVVDTEFRYRRINRRLAGFNGRPQAEHLGRLASDLYPHLFQIWAPYWRQVIATGEPVENIEMSGPGQDGLARHALVSYYPVRVGEGPVVGVGIVVADITERKRAEEERLHLLSSEQAAREAAQEAQARAEAAVQMRDTFLSIAAHELKTPLTSLLGQAQLLERRMAQSGTLDGANERSLKVVVSQARRLSHLIGDLLDGAHLETGQLSIDQKPLDLGRLVRQVAEDLQPSLAGHTMVCQSDGEPLTVRGDLVRLEQVLQNLLSNAVKYSPRGTTITLWSRRESERALVSVRDQGAGIDPAAIPHLFERFYRVDSPETRAISGVGVGLYVVREIVRLHGGEVWVESTPGEGSTFTFALPVA